MSHKREVHSSFSSNHQRGLMRHCLILSACLLALPLATFAARIDARPVASDTVHSSGKYAAAMRLSPDGLRVLATLERCRENVFDWPRQCSEEVFFEIPGLTVDAENRRVMNGDEVVARWSRFGRFLRLEPNFRLAHEITTEHNVQPIGSSTLRRATLYLEQI